MFLCGCALSVLPVASTDSVWKTTTMSQHKSPFDSTCAVLKCTSDYFRRIYAQETPTDDEVLTNFIGSHQRLLSTPSQPCHLDKLLSTMLIHAPHPLGRQYVAVTLKIAHEKGDDVVLSIAKAWLQHLFLPSRLLHPSSSSSFLMFNTPVLSLSSSLAVTGIDQIFDADELVGGPDQSEPGSLKNKVCSSCLVLAC